MPPNTRPLAVHVVFHHESSGSPSADSRDPSAAFVEKLIAGLSDGERSGKVPVRLWQGRNGASDFQFPSSVPLETADKNVVVIVVDHAMFAARKKWGEYISSLLRRVRAGRDLVLPIAYGSDAAKLSPGLSDVSHIDVRDLKGLVREERALQRVYASVIGHLLGKVPRVFLCHAKADGDEIVHELHDYLKNNTQLSSFLDVHDLPDGREVKNSIRTVIKESIVVVVWTDRLLRSPWCQYEIIEARRLQRPLLVLDALTEQTPRLFPFLGNMPVVRWQNNPAPIVTALLSELLRVFHLKAVFECLKGPDRRDVHFGLHPPDLLASRLAEAEVTVHPLDQDQPRQPATEFVYPDPPLKLEELRVLKRLIPRSRFFTLTEWHALRAGEALQVEWDDSADVRPNPMRAMQIGISVSQAANWAELGMTVRHQDDLAAEIALNLILLGAKVVWGGDLRPDGIGSRLRQIVEAYQHPTHPTQDHVALYTPFTPGASLSSQALEERQAFADVHVLSCPIRMGNDTASKTGTDAIDGAALAAMAFSDMRATMARECHARILLGGRLHGFKGIYPGVVEEAYWSVTAGCPIYILGGFGGAAHAVFESIVRPSGDEAAELAAACQEFGADANRSVRDEHARLVDVAGRGDLRFNPAAAPAAFARLESPGLSELNCLSESENDVLSKSDDLYEILGLLVKGLVMVSRES